MVKVGSVVKVHFGRMKWIYIVGSKMVEEKTKKREIYSLQKRR